MKPHNHHDQPLIRIRRRDTAAVAGIGGFVLFLFWIFGELGFLETIVAISTIAALSTFYYLTVSTTLNPAPATTRNGEAADAAVDTAMPQRMLDGLQAEGEAPVLVHWALAEDIRTLNRVRGAVDDGRPLPIALRESRVWGVKEKLVERVLPTLGTAQLARWLDDAHTVDGIVKGLKFPDWPAEPWQALHQLAMKVARACAPR